MKRGYSDGTESWREWEEVGIVTKKGGHHLWNKGEGERRFKQLIVMCISEDNFITYAQVLSQILQKPAYFFSNLQLQLYNFLTVLSATL